MIRRAVRAFCTVMDTKRKKVLNFQGPVVAVFTPFKSDGSLNLDEIEPYAKYLQDNNIKGIFVTGSTGEFLSLTCDERKKLLEKWMQHGKDKLDLIIAHIGSACMTETKELAKHAAEKGVDSIAMIPPIYYKPNNNDELISYMSEIASVAVETPVLYYHIPSMSGHQINLSDVIPEMIEKVPGFAGFKYTSNDLKDAVLCNAKYRERIKIFLGADELQLNGLVSGLSSCILISANMFPALSTGIHTSYKENDLHRALAIQNKLICTIDGLSKHGPFFQVFKEAMNIVAPINVGPTRRPLLPVKDVSSLRSMLTKLDANAA